jgi:hypothetical protein
MTVVSTFEIKIAAILAMLLDHAGEFFWPQVIWLRWVGRLAFPLFAWLVANGVKHTQDEKKYLIRLVVFAVVSQWPYLWARQSLQPDFWGLNVLFTLALGLLAIWAVKSKANNWGKLGFLFLICAAAVGLKMDYGATGVLSVLASYVFFDSWRALVFSQAIIFSAGFWLVGIWNLAMPGQLKIGISGYNELLAPLAFLVIYFYDGKLGPKAKYLFYVVYPLQFVIIGFLRRYI